MVLGRGGRPEVARQKQLKLPSSCLPWAGLGAVRVRERDRGWSVLAWAQLGVGEWVWSRMQSHPVCLVYARQQASSSRSLGPQSKGVRGVVLLLPYVRMFRRRHFIAQTTNTRCNTSTYTFYFISLTNLATFRACTINFLSPIPLRSFGALPQYYHIGGSLACSH